LAYIVRGNTTTNTNSNINNVQSQASIRSPPSATFAVALHNQCGCGEGTPPQAENKHCRACHGNMFSWCTGVYNHQNCLQVTPLLSVAHSWQLEDQHACQQACERPCGMGFICPMWLLQRMSQACPGLYNGLLCAPQGAAHGIVCVCIRENSQIWHQCC